MQARTISDNHDCRTPTVDGLIERGVRITGAHTPLPTCSPARASLMTGLLPHNPKIDFWQRFAPKVVKIDLTEREIRFQGLEDPYDLSSLCGNCAPKDPMLMFQFGKG